MFKGARKEGRSLGDKKDPARVTSRARMEVEIRGDDPGRICEHADGLVGLCVGWQKGVGWSGLEWLSA